MVDAWADADDVEVLTGIDDATDAELIRAQRIIEIYVGVTFDATIDSPRNLRHLNSAVAYQMAWMRFQPGLFIHSDVDNVSQDGHSHTPAHDAAALVAPLAMRCIRRLTWMQKSLRVRSRSRAGDYDDYGSRDSAVADDARIWIPL